MRDVTVESITCDVCGRTSYHPRDIKEGYCGNCHDWTGGHTNYPKGAPAVPELELISAPFTEEQVQQLNYYQKYGKLHPFTCPTRSTTLVADVTGWTCPCCDYTQDWAHDFMAHTPADDGEYR